jgi:hypothetical protein
MPDDYFDGVTDCRRLARCQSLFLLLRSHGGLRLGGQIFGLNGCRQPVLSDEFLNGRPQIPAPGAGQPLSVMTQASEHRYIALPATASCTAPGPTGDEYIIT